MSRHTDTDSESDESDVDYSDKKALPWHSFEIVKRENALYGDSNLENSKKICSNNVTVAGHSISLDVDKLQIGSEKHGTSLEIQTQKNTLPENASGNIEIEDIDMEGPEINILLLGESGVGKSTFINSFANYMKHENFEAVQENDLSVLIPARFHIFDKEFKQHKIEIGAKDENEYLADGAAATQDVKTYVFYITIEKKPYTIRLIDTPGMGDPKGIDQDNKNCDYVLNYLGRLEKIHAICLLLKPTNTRLDVFLNYCITQILSRLEKSATENIAFIFTNTRGQNYTPGDTYTSLELLVKKIKDTNNVSLPLSHKNVFCFDNEAFRFLAAIKDGVEFREGILEANIESWKYSYKEVYRLLSYIVQLKPHDPKKTVSINHARKMVLQLSQPLAEIVQLIGDNIYNMEQHTNQLLTENQTLDELKQKLYMPIVDIRVKELPQPVTVCTAPKCSTVYKVAEKNKFHYKQRCHNPCYLNNVPAEIVGDPNLLQCAAMHGSQTCFECGCRFNTHMHIYYETDTFENKIEDKNILKNITCKEDAAREKQNIINQMLNHKEQLETEHKYIIKCSAEFAHFLQQNAITPMNDSLKEYVKYLITREESLGPNINRTTLQHLRRVLSEYEQERKVLEQALQHNTSGIVTSSPNMIESRVRNLFTLPNFGAKIKKLYSLHESGGLKEHKQSEVVVREQYTLSIMDKFKSKLAGAFDWTNSKKQQRRDQNKQRALEYEREQHLVMQQQYFQNNPWNGNPYNMNPYGPRSYFNDRDMYHGWEEQKYISSAPPQLQHRYTLEDKNRGIGRIPNAERQYLQNPYECLADISDEETCDFEQQKFNNTSKPETTKKSVALFKNVKNKSEGLKAVQTNENEGALYNKNKENKSLKQQKSNNLSLSDNANAPEYSHEESNKGSKADSYDRTQIKLSGKDNSQTHVVNKEIKNRGENLNGDKKGNQKSKK